MRKKKTRCYLTEAVHTHNNNNTQSGQPKKNASMTKKAKYTNGPLVLLG